jgi:hypothetical protein
MISFSAIGQWPPRAGSLALRGRIAAPCAWASPLILFVSHTPRGSNGGDQGPGTKKQRANRPSFSSSPSFSVASRLSVHVRSQAQCLSQPIRSRNEANRLFYTHSPAGSRQPSINLFYSSPPVKGEYPQGEGVR